MWCKSVWEIIRKGKKGAAECVWIWLDVRREGVVKFIVWENVIGWSMKVGWWVIEGRESRVWEAEEES